MKKFLSLLLTAMLIGAMPVCMATEDVKVSFDISSDFNYDTIFTEKDGLKSTDVLLTSVGYDSKGFSSKISLGELDYSFEKGHKVLENDSVKINASYTATLGNEPYKKIGFVAFGIENSVSVNVKLNYKDSTTETINVDVKKATEKASETLSVSGGTELKDNGKKLGRKIETGTNELFINAYEIVPEKASAISSIEFNASDCVIMAVSALKYTQAELDNMSSGAINTYWETYKDKKVNEIADSDVENLNTLYNGLVTAKNNNTNTEIATDENIEKISNLKDGYQLYKTKKGYSEYFQNAYATTDYRTLSATDISDSDISVIEEIVAKYTEAESFNETKYQEIMTYFGLTDEFNTYDLSDKETLVNLKTTYERNKDEKELNDKIDAIYNVYKDKTTSDLADSDITELDKLIGYYEEAKTKEYSYSEENYAQIKKLKEYYERQQVAGKYTYVDLTPYLNADLMVKQGDVYTAEEQKTLARTKYLFNGGSIPQDGLLTIVAPKKSYTPDADQNEVGRTYKLSGDYKGKGIDVVKVAKDSTAVTNIKVPVTMVKENGFGVILDTDAGEVGASGPTASYAKKVTVNVNYTDGSMDEVKVNLLRSEGYYLADYYSNAQTVPGRLDINESGTAYNLGNVSGNNSPRFYSSNIPFNHDKIVSSFTFNKISGCDYTIIAMYADPVSNVDFIEMLKAQWDIVKDFNSASVTSEQLPDTNKMVAYVDECDRRGIDPEEYGIDTALVDSFREMNLTATSTVYRADKNTVKAEFDFSVAVTQTDIKNKLTVTKNAKEFTDYTAEFSNNGKKLTLTFNETQNGGNAYNVILSGGLSIEKFPSITLGADNSFSYTVPDYMEISHDGSKFTVKNHSTKEVKGYVGISILETDEKTVVYSNVLPYTVEGESSVDVDCDTTAYNSKAAKIMLWDENMNVVSNANSVSACTSEVVKTADYNEPTFDMKTESVKLSGITPSKEAGKLVSLKVVEKSGRRSVGDVIFAGVQKTTKDGYFDFGFVLPSQGSKTLEFTIGGDDFAKPKTLTKTIYYFAPTERQAYIESLKGMNEATLIAEIPTMKEKLAIAFDPANAISNSDYAKAIIVNSDQLIPTDVAKTQENLKKIAIVAAFSGDNAQLLMSGSEFKYDDIMKYSEIDSNGVTLYSILKNGISDKGIAEFKKAVFSKNYANESELFLAIKQAIFLNAINYPKNGGVGYIADLLTAKNAQSAQIDITNYLNNASYDFNTAIAQKAGSFKNLAEVAAFIANYKVVVTPGYVGGGNTTGGSAGGSGGSVSGGFSSNVTEEPKYTFNDVTNVHWAYENIISLYNKGIISGKAPKIFEPESTITRGELVKMICTAYNLKAVNSGKFVDTKGKWYEEYAQAGYDNGIINGITENEFGGDLPITRQDICTILYRLSKGQSTLTLTFADANGISDYAKNAVAFMVEKGIVNGFTDNTFAPNNNCTRAQAAKIIDMFLQMK